MRNMRKAAAVLLATGMVFALTACGGNKKSREYSKFH